MLILACTNLQNKQDTHQLLEPALQHQNALKLSNMPKRTAVFIVVAPMPGDDCHVVNNVDAFSLSLSPNPRNAWKIYLQLRACS